MSWWYAVFIACGFFTAGFALCGIMMDGKRADEESEVDYTIRMLRAEIDLMKEEAEQYREKISYLSYQLLLKDPNHAD